MIDFEEEVTTGEALRRVDQKNWLTKHGRPVPKALSKAERLEYQKCFDMIEADSGGSLSADDIHKLLTAFGDKVSLAEVRLAMSKCGPRRGGSLTYAEFEAILSQQQSQSMTSDNTASVDKNQQSLGPRLQMLAIAYCRKQMVDGAMSNKGDWRNTFLDRKHKETEVMKQSQNSQAAKLSLKRLAAEERRKMFGTWKLSPKSSSPAGSRSPASPGRSRSPTASPRALAEQPLLFQSKGRGDWDGKVKVAFGSTIRPFQFLSEAELYNTAGSVEEIIPEAPTTDWLNASGSLKFAPSGAEMTKWWTSVNTRKQVHRRMEKTFGSLPQEFVSREFPSKPASNQDEQAPLSMSTAKLQSRSCIQSLRTNEFRPGLSSQRQKIAAIEAVRRGIEAA